MQFMIPELSPFPTVALVGLGNIGSQTIDALGRIRSLKRAVLVDPDIYSESNLGSQRISRRDLNALKARVQARRLAEINPGLEVVPIIDGIANVPRGLLRGAVVLTALDSAESRRDACEAAWRVGSTVIDGGVEPELGLGRVSVYVPHAGAPCFECALEEEDYQAMPTRHVCGAGEADDVPTNGSPSLGALVGSLMVIEAEKLLAGRLAGSLAGSQLVVDVTHHKQFVTRLNRNVNCRFDHSRRDIRTLTGVTERSTLGNALGAVRAAFGTSRKISLGVDGHEFAKVLHCPGCGAANPTSPGFGAAPAVQGAELLIVRRSRDARSRLQEARPGRRHRRAGARAEPVLALARGARGRRARGGRRRTGKLFRGGP